MPTDFSFSHAFRLIFAHFKLHYCCRFIFIFGFVVFFWCGGSSKLILGKWIANIVDVSFFKYFFERLLNNRFGWLKFLSTIKFIKWYRRLACILKENVWYDSFYNKKVEKFCRFANHSMEFFGLVPTAFVYHRSALLCRK